jgi:hypothetical protein
MEAPTPVSALLHAATLVTAGIYLLLRCSPILEYSPTALMVITIVGASTAFFAATSGLVQNDLKRIIAFSTISQLGYFIIITNFIFLYYVIFASFPKEEAAEGCILFDFLSYMAQPSKVKVADNVVFMGPLASLISIDSLNIKDMVSPSINKKVKFIDFSYASRSIIKKNYNKVPGIYL